MPPLVFSPILKRIRWGGRRLGTVLGKPIGPEADYAESWELVDHGDDQSPLTCSPKGAPLAMIVRECNRDLFGRHAGHTQFPLLVKFLDASDRLSVQVHPDDARARNFDPRENGKTEAWVIVEAAPGSRLYAGLKAGVDRHTLVEHLERGTVAEVLHSLPVAAGDCVFIPAGTVHAIGEGILLAEIQQSSDLTFRLFDWNRLDTDGKPRPLHVEQSLACVDFDRGPVLPVTPRRLAELGHAAEELVRCDHFVMRRHRLDAQQSGRVPTDDRFHVLTVLDGTGELRTPDGESMQLPRGQTVLVPASCADITLSAGPAPMTVLEAFLP